MKRLYLLALLLALVCSGVVVADDPPALSVGDFQAVANNTIELSELDSILITTNAHLVSLIDGYHPGVKGKYKRVADAVIKVFPKARVYSNSTLNQIRVVVLKLPNGPVEVEFNNDCAINSTFNGREFRRTLELTWEKRNLNKSKKLLPKIEQILVAWTRIRHKVPDNISYKFSAYHVLDITLNREQLQAYNNSKKGIKIAGKTE